MIQSRGVLLYEFLLYECTASLHVVVECKGNVCWPNSRSNALLVVIWEETLKHWKQLIFYIQKSSKSSCDGVRSKSSGLLSPCWNFRISSWLQSSPTPPNSNICGFVRCSAKLEGQRYNTFIYQLMTHRRKIDLRQFVHLSSAGKGLKKDCIEL